MSARARLHSLPPIPAECSRSCVGPWDPVPLSSSASCHGVARLSRGKIVVASEWQGDVPPALSDAPAAGVRQSPGLSAEAESGTCAACASSGMRRLRTVCVVPGLGSFINLGAIERDSRSCRVPCRPAIDPVISWLLVRPVSPPSAIPSDRGRASVSRVATSLHWAATGLSGDRRAPELVMSATSTLMMNGGAGQEQAGDDIFLGHGTDRGGDTSS